MNISVEYNVDLNYNETFNHKVKFHLGGFELNGEALYENVCDRFDNYNGKAAYSIRHPFPYYLKVSLPYDKEERKAIYKFISSNQDKIRQDYGLVFEFDRVAGDLRGYENECRILGVDVTASTEEIKNKYREQSLKWHPDRWTTGTEEEKKTAEAKFKEISSAYDKLRLIDTDDVKHYFYITDLWQKSKHEAYDRQLAEEKKQRIASLSF